MPYGIYFWIDKKTGKTRIKGLPNVRCGAKTRAGTPCKNWAVFDGYLRPRNGRCYMHGGLSTGPKTERGKERSRRGRQMRAKKAVEKWQADFTRALLEIWERWYRTPVDEKMARPWEWWKEWDWKKFKLEEPLDIANMVFDKLIKDWKDGKDF